MVYCTICGKEIPEERIAILPDTKLCVEHAQAVQKFGGEFKLTGIQGNIGKAGSLKKNYGDVDVKKSNNYQAVEKLRKQYNCDHPNAYYYGDTYPVTYKCDDCGLTFVKAD